MPEPKVLLDEMLNRGLAEHLRKEGWDATAISENVELLGISDSEVLSLAHTQGRVVITLNVSDFARLHAQTLTSGRSHSGIWCIPSRRFVYSKDVHSRIAQAMKQARPPGENEIAFLNM